MKHFHKNLARILSLVLMVSMIPFFGIGVSAAFEPAETEAVRVGLFSDSHISTQTTEISRILDSFATIDANYDGFAMVGDIILQSTTMNSFVAGTTQPADMLSNAGYTTLKSIFKDKGIVTLDDDGKITEKKLPYIFGLGNHEFPHFTNSNKEGHAEVAAAAKAMYQEEMGEALNSDILIGGYHFITAAQRDYTNVMTAEGEAFMMEKINAAVAEDPNKPVFLILHKSVWNTTYGSSEEGTYECPYTDEFVSFLNQKPQVILISGHTHRYQNDPRTVWQGGFTSFSIGGVGPGYTEQEVSMLEISEDNVVTVKRMETVNGNYVGSDLVFDIPNMVANPGDTQYWKYTDARYDNAETPTFAQDAAVNAISITTSGATAEFPQPQGVMDSDDNVVTQYRVKVINTKLQTKVQDYLVTSDFYKPADLRSSLYTAAISGLDAGTQYTVEISALSPWGPESAAISGTFTTTANATSDTEETIFPDSPEADDRNPIYKYVAATNDGTNYVVNYDEIYTPGRNRKEVTADDNGNYPEGSFTATVGGVEKHYVNSFGKDTRFGFGGRFITMYEAGTYVTFSLDVPADGLYELLGIGANSVSSTMSVTIDGFPLQESYVLPAGDPNYTYGAMYDGVYAPITTVPLTAGTHTIKLKLDQQAASQVLIWGVALAPELNTTLISKGIAESDLTASIANTSETFNGVPKYTPYEGRVANFNVEVPEDGEYVLYMNNATSATGHTFSVLVDGVAQLSATVATSGLADVRAMRIPGVLSLAKGTRKISIATASSVEGETYGYLATTGFTLARTGSLVNKSWKFNKNYSDTFEAYTAGGNGNVDGAAFGMANNCYAIVRFTPVKTGYYDLVYKAASVDGIAYITINGEALATWCPATADPNLASAIDSPAYSAVFMAGKTYDIKFLKNGGGDLTLVGLNISYTGETDGTGIYYDIYAGDSIADNYESQGASSLKYGDGHGDSGWGCYGGLYADYSFTIETDGLYDITLVAGTDGPGIKGSVILDNQNLGTKELAYADGENWAIRRNNDFGEVLLRAGTHTLRVQGVDGNMQIFKTRIAFSGADDGSTPLSFVIDSHDYSETGGSNVQMPTSPYNGTVLGEGNSYAEYIVDVPAGNYLLGLCYGAKSFGGRAKVTVNGATMGTYDLPQNNTWIYAAEDTKNNIVAYDTNNYYGVEILSLREGENTIRIMCDKFADGNGYAYFSYSSFKLERVTAPQVQLFAGDYATPEGKLSALTNGTMVVRSFLPNTLAGKAVTMLACIYQDGVLYQVADATLEDATIGDVMVTKFVDVALDDAHTYTYKFFYWDGVNAIVPLCAPCTTIQ